jgi:hypothetical protein
VTEARPQPGAAPVTRSHHYLPATAKTVHWGHFSKLLPQIVRRSGDFVTIEVLTHHANNDAERMVAGDPGAESVFHWDRHGKGAPRAPDGEPLRGIVVADGEHGVPPGVGPRGRHRDLTGRRVERQVAVALAASITSSPASGHQNVPRPDTPVARSISSTRRRPTRLRSVSVVPPPRLP